MKINIVTKDPQETLNQLRGTIGSNKVHIDLIRSYGEISSDYDITIEDGNCISLEALNELIDTYKPWDIRIY